MASMKQYETPLQQAQCQVIEAEAWVAAQVAWIAELNRLHYNMAEAEAMLAELTSRLRCVCEERNRLQASQ
jgi:hypothetical protein